jgi:hypothetical protein
MAGLVPGHQKPPAAKSWIRLPVGQINFVSRVAMSSLSFENIPLAPSGKSVI